MTNPRTRSADHAQDKRGSRTQETPEAEAPELILETPEAEAPEVEQTPEQIAEAEAEARALALTSSLAEHAPKDALNALIRAHFDGSVLKFLRSVIRSVDADVRNRALFTRRANNDGSIAYELCGFSGTISRDASGKFRQDGFLMQARDASGNSFEKRFGDGSSTYDALDTPQKNMLAGFRNGIIWILNERETERKVSRTGDNTQALADMERKLAEAEARAKQAEENARVAAEAQATQSATLQAILARLDASDASKNAQAS